MTSRSAGANTLPDAPDPLHYVPLPEHERALAALRDALACGMTRIALLGPPGFGKTLLLRRLKADCPPASRVFYIPFSTVGDDELASWLLSWMGAQAGSLCDDDFITWARVEQRLGRRCVLLLDEAQALSPETAGRIDGWVARAGGALQIVASGIEGAEFETVLGCFDPSLHRVGLRKPLRGEALRVFADALIERTLGVRGDAPTWLWEEAELYDKTSGVPRLVKAELRARLEKTPVPPPPAAASIAAARQAALPPSPSALAANAQEIAAAPETRRPAPPEASRPRAVRKMPTPTPTPRPRSARRRPSALASIAMLLPVALLLTPSLHQSVVSASQPAPAPATQAVETTVPLHVNADPWAHIRVDGRLVGMTPLADLPVAPGEHEVIAVFPDGREMIKRVSAQAPGASVSFP